VSRGQFSSIAALSLVLSACNSDRPVSATADLPEGLRITVTRVATHPFLARFDLSVTVNGSNGCVASSDLFPDTGGVSRRNIYVGATGLLYVIGQFDARVFDGRACSVMLREFRFLEQERQYLGAFDVTEGGRWTFLPAVIRPEQPFERP